MKMFELWTNTQRGAVVYEIAASSQDEASGYFFKNVYRQGFHYGAYMISTALDIPLSRNVRSRLVTPAKDSNGHRIAWDFSYTDYTRDLYNRNKQINESCNLFSLENLV